MTLKRLLAVVIAFVMLSTMTVAFAAKKVATENEDPNIVSTWGSLDSEAMVGMLKKRSSTVTYEKKGKNKGCAKVQVTGDWGGASIPAPFVVGETYDISFDLKTDNASAEMICIMFYEGDRWKYIHPTGRFEKDWTTYKVTFTNNGISDAGEQTSGAGSINIRYGNGQTRATYYIDNLSVVPHGKVDADYSSLKLKASSEVPEVEINAQPAPLPTAAISFSDMKNHWAEDTVNTLATYGYIDGMGDGTYAPQSNVTRAQFVKMMTDTLNLRYPEYKGEFSDVSSDDWFAPFVQLASDLELLEPAMTFGKRFLPNQAITREEAAYIASKIAELKNAKVKENNISFKDESSASVWAQDAVKAAAGYGLIKGYEDASFLPKANITRAEAAQILMRVAQITTIFSIYVDSETGNDKNDGTIEAPLATVYAAQEKVRSINDTMKNDIKVYIKGRHYIDKTLEFTNEDSGKNGYRVIYTSWGAEKPVLSMGKIYDGFSLFDKDKNVYRTFVGNIESRHAYFNNVRGIRARTISSFTNPTFSQSGNSITYTAENPELSKLKYPGEVEGVYHYNWYNSRLMFSHVSDNGDGSVTIKMREDAGKEFWNAWDDRKDHRRFPTYLENAFEFLDQPGEWYLDSHEGYMYYIPRSNEDMSKLQVTIPTGDVLLTVTGESFEEPVCNITFDNIEFADVGYMKPTRDGGINTPQNFSITENKASDLPQHNITVEAAHYIDFTNNKFTRMGSSALVLHKTIQHCNVIGNEFFDISGVAVNMGSFKDKKLPENTAQLNEYNKLNNNYIHQVAVEFGSAAGIGVCYMRHTEVNHNEIVNTPYSGMHIGWGWNAFAVEGTQTYDLEIGYNYIHETEVDRLYDGASIYTLGANSLDSVNLKSRIVGNYMENNRNAYGNIYLDEGSTHWHVYDNVVNMNDVKNWRYNFGDQGVVNKESIYWLMMNWSTLKGNIVENNYATTGVIRNNTIEGDNIIGETLVYPDANWPEEAKAIINNAGIEDEYIGNFATISGPQSFVAREREYEVSLNESVPLDIAIYGQYMEEYPLSDFDIDYWVSRPDILKVSEDGVMTVIGSGEVLVVANVVVDGKIQMHDFKVWAGEDYESLAPSKDVINMVSGYESNLKVNTVTTFGRKVAIPHENVTYTSNDESVVKVTENGIVTTVGRGETTIRIQAEYKGLTLDCEIPVNIITYSQPDSLELPYEEAPASMFVAANWSGSSVSRAPGTVSVSGSPSYFHTQSIKNKLIAFDMSIENPNDWPSITFCAPDRMGSYANSDCYMIGFKEGFVELQRFTKGKRTMIFGQNEYGPIGGPGFPNPVDNPIYKYGAENKVSVIIGALDTEEGTRIVLTINGENILDYLDKTEGRLPAEGYIGVYNSGTFTFSPYTGITK